MWSDHKRAQSILDEEGRGKNTREHGEKENPGIQWVAKTGVLFSSRCKYPQMIELVQVDKLKGPYHP